MEACETCYLVHLLRSSIDVAVLQVVEDGVVEQNGVLTTTQLEEKERGFREYYYCSRGLRIQRQG